MRPNIYFNSILSVFIEEIEKFFSLSGIIYRIILYMFIKIKRTSWDKTSGGALPIYSSVYGYAATAGWVVYVPFES